MGFQQGLSGLDASSKALEAISNNVSNASTVGFKQAEAQFSDVFAAALNGAGGSQIGIGTAVSGVAQQFSQGNITVTSNPLDLAINGSGFFRLSDNGAVTYTRNGQFQVDKSGFVVNGSGAQLTGYPADFSADPTGLITKSKPVPLVIDPAPLSPKATSDVTLSVNLDSRSAAPIAGHTNFDITDPLSYTASTSVTINDQLGDPIVMSTYFVKTNVTGQWDMHVSVGGIANSAAVVGPPAVAAVTVVTPDVTTLQFDSGGKLTSPLIAPSFTIDLDQMAANQIPPVANNASPTQTFTVNLSASTQFGTAFGSNNVIQDGFSAGALSGISVNSDGIIQGRYANGQSRKLGQVALARFNNSNGLVSMGGSQWTATSLSGSEMVDAPGASSNGLLQSAAVEESNVDLTAELVSMMTQQRAYQANAQSIKTIDQLLQTLVNLR